MLHIGQLVSPLSHSMLRRLALSFFQVAVPVRKDDGFIAHHFLVSVVLVCVEGLALLYERVYDLACVV